LLDSNHLCSSAISRSVAESRLVNCLFTRQCISIHLTPLIEHWSD